MIVINTHIWIWWVHDESLLSQHQRRVLKTNESDTIGISTFSCWEIAKLVEKGRIRLPRPLLEWFELAVSYPGVRLLTLTPEIAARSTQLPGNFHSDPADQVIVATARARECRLVTSDGKILDYEHVETVG